MTTTADRLRALATAATPGPWRHGPLFWEVWSEDVRVAEVPHAYPDGARQPGVYVDPEINRSREPDAAFIAALSPERVLALADLVEAAEAVVDVRTRLLGGWSKSPALRDAVAIGPSGHRPLADALARVEEAFREP